MKPDGKLIGNKIKELKVNLFHLFAQHGEVIEIGINPGFKMRGQAFVVFREQEMADKALAALNGFKMFGKPIVNCNSLSRRPSNMLRSQVM